MGLDPRPPDGSSRTVDPTKPNWESTRETMHRVCAHVLARRRFDVSGHFGLRASPGGVTTPAFGPEPESIRIAGAVMGREIGGAGGRLGFECAPHRGPRMCAG